MKPETINLLTWEDVKEVIETADSMEPDASDERSYYLSILATLKENNKTKTREHYLHLIGKAEQATGCKATRKRTYDSVLTRSFVSYRLWKEGMTYHEIGRLMERDHATIVNQVKNIRNMMELPKAYQREVEMLGRFENSLNDGDEE